MSYTQEQVFTDPLLLGWARRTVGVPNVTTSAAILPARLASGDSRTVRPTNSQDITTLGVVPSGAASGLSCNVEYGSVNVQMASPCYKLNRLAARKNGYAGCFMKQQVNILSSTVGDGFTNQPAGDTVEVISSDAGDVIQSVTIYGTITGALTTVTSETIRLDGTTASATSTTTWEKVLGVELDSAAAGTVTVREQSGGLTITTISTGSTASGVHDSSEINAYGLIPRIVADAANTDDIGLVGTGIDGQYRSVVVALAGAVEKAADTEPYSTVDKVLLGGLTTQAATVKTHNVADTVNVGIALEDCPGGGVVIEANIHPYYV